MFVRTEVAKQAEQFQIGDVHYVGRRVFFRNDTNDALDDSMVLDSIEQRVFHRNEWRWYVLFRLDYDRGLIFVDPSILRPYQRPERKEEASK